MALASDFLEEQCDTEEDEEQEDEDNDEEAACSTPSSSSSSCSRGREGAADSTVGSNNSGSSGSHHHRGPCHRRCRSGSKAIATINRSAAETDDRGDPPVNTSPRHTRMYTNGSITSTLSPVEAVIDGGGQEEIMGKEATLGSRSSGRAVRAERRQATTTADAPDSKSRIRGSGSGAGTDMCCGKNCCSSELLEEEPPGSDCRSAAVVMERDDGSRSSFGAGAEEELSMRAEAKC